MNLNRIQKELKKFDKYKFYPEPHIYTYIDNNGKEVEISTSVTSLIEEYTQEFDKESMAEIKARRECTTKEEILDKWKYDNDFACIKGTITHVYNEYLWQNKKYEYDKEEIIKKFGKDVIEPIWDKLKRISDSFYSRFKDNLIPVGLEQVIGSIDYDIAGTIDFLAYSKKLDALIIIDYKTNKEIKNKSFDNEKMLKPLDNIPDANFYHYSLQLSIYKYLLEYETNLKVYSKKWLVWINENNSDFKLYECANLDDKAKKLLELRKVEV